MLLFRISACLLHQFPDFFIQAFCFHQLFQCQVHPVAGTAPAIATPELCEEVVRNHLYSNSILCILSLQDWLSMDGKWRNPNVQEERINIPANPRHYWRYRHAPDTGTTDEGRKPE